VKLPAYPRTKPSGVEWLDDVPEHWDSQGVKFCYSIQLGKMLQPEPTSPTDEETPYLKSQHVQWEHVRVSELPTMWTNKKERRQYAVKDGDLLVCEGGDVGRAAVVYGAPDGTIIQNALHRVRPQGENETGFLLYVLAHAASQGWFEIICNKSTIAHFTVDKFGALGVALPDPAEQRAVAAFLDWETGRVDRLVAKKRELIERLNEKRTALVSRTVTRGLPPAAARAAGLPANPPLKPSGIEWIGDIPKHWDIVAYKRVCTRVDVGIAEAATHAYCDDGVPIIRSTNVKPNKLDTSDVLRIEPWFAAKNRTKTLRAGDLVTVRTGYPGTTAVVPPEFDGCQCFTLVLSTPKRTAHGPFFSWVLNSNPGASYFEMEGWGTAQTNISVPIVRFMPVPRPPLPEQVAIAAYLDLETAKLDTLVGKVEEAVERLQEYRTALISAAVTGKIDVRKEVAL
jgi:type I restriction enzyme S subunit